VRSLDAERRAASITMANPFALSTPHPARDAGLKGLAALDAVKHVITPPTLKDVIMRSRHLLSILLVGLLTCGPSEAQAPRSFDTNILAESFGVTLDEQIDAPISEVMQGCPQRDCIPSIDTPTFLPPGQSGITADEDLVMGVNFGGVARAYPIHILNMHEIVNDQIGDLALAVTWCPLCGSGLVFDRTLGDKTVEFGVSGLLHNSDLIVYDRATSSLWQQITGRAIAGTRRGQMLRSLPVSLTTWAEWRTANPSTQLLSTDTGHKRDYGNKQPYGDYDSNERLLFPARGAAGLRLHPKTVVHGIELETGSVAVSERALKAESSVSVIVEGDTLVFERQQDGSVRARSEGRKADLVAHRMFWFAWASFHPGTTLYDPQGLPAARQEDGK
jgi:hypothetical protein